MSRNKSRVELWVNTMWKMHSLTRANKKSLETINSLVTHIHDGKPMLAVQSNEELAAITKAIQFFSEDTDDEDYEDVPKELLEVTH